MLEQITYEVPRALERKQVVYQIGDLESLSATALYYGDGSSSGSSSGFGGGLGFGIVERKDKKKGPSSGGPKPSISIESIRLARNTEYFQLSNTVTQTMGVTHHPSGLGKLKIYDKETDKEYGVSLRDILNKPLKDWGIDKK